MRLIISCSMFPVGGIYTVIRSKAFVSVEEMGDQYCLIGPYKETSARTEVEEADFPRNSPLNIAVQILRDQGFKVSLDDVVKRSNFQLESIVVAEIVYYAPRIASWIKSKCKAKINSRAAGTSRAVVLQFL